MKIIRLYLVITLCIFTYVLVFFISWCGFKWVYDVISPPSEMLPLVFLSWKFVGDGLILPSFMNCSFAPYRTLGWKFYSFNILNISSHCFLAPFFILSSANLNVVPLLIMRWVCMCMCLEGRLLLRFCPWLCVMSRCGPLCTYPTWS